jgi:anti-anti-sigma regulatory factor
VLDCSSIPDVDYSAGAAVHALVNFMHNRGATVALAGLDPDLRATFDRFGELALLHLDHVYETVEEAIAAFQAVSPSPVTSREPPHPQEP